MQEEKALVKKERHLLTDKIKNMCVQCKRYPHYRMILYISIITIVSGVLSICLFCSLPAVSALLTSICAGCITGIVFYILANVRNNEMNASREEWESLNEHYQICQQTQKLCLTVVTNSDVSKENIAQICANTRKLFRFMACLCIDLPRAARIIKDYPLDYLEHLKRADAAITDLETMQELSERKPKGMMDILPFISQTEEIIITPWLKLMENVAYLESSGI